MMRKPVYAALFATWALLMPQHAAQASLVFAYYPMIQFMQPITLMLLVPIILMEAAILKKVLKVTYRRAFVVFGTANVITTILGYPIVFALLVLWQAVWTWVFARFPLPEPVLSEPWNPFGEVECTTILYFIHTFTELGMKSSDSYCALGPIITLINFVVAFFGSFVIEYWVLRWFYRQEPKATLRMISFRANLLSYLSIIICLVLAMLGLFVFGTLFGWF